MARLRLWLLTVLACLIGTGVQGQVSLLRLDDAAVSRPDRGIAPLLEEWVRQSPIPTARNLWGVAWATATHGFAAGESLTLVETFDGGTTWRDVVLPSSSTDPLYNVS